MLDDGLLWATWRIDRDRDNGSATLVLDHVGRPTARARGALSAEGRRFLRFAAADADDHEVRFVPRGS